MKLRAIRAKKKSKSKQSTTASESTLVIGGQTFVVVSLRRYRELKDQALTRLVVKRQGKAGGRLQRTKLPKLPAVDEAGNYPAAETIRALIARDIIRRRKKIGLSQVELARRAGVRPETLNRIEKAVYAPNATTTARIEAVLEAAEARS